MIAYEADTAGKILLLIMRTLNQGVYSLINTLCQLFMNISKTSLFGGTENVNIMNDFLGRIYAVLGILMLFKLAFSLLTSIVNPDALTDKEKGMQKIIPRTIVALLLLIMTPTVFKYALEWQNDIAMAVPRIIIGKSASTDELAESNEGELLASTALKAFITQTDGCSNVSEDLENANQVEDVLYLTTNKCDGGTGKMYMYQFNGFVSLIVGIVLVVLLASYCIDIAIRTIKIGLLRILAPIPIISYIDPKSEKNGAFSNWLKESVSTYLELFIKLAILYFVLYILGGIASGDNSLFYFPNVSGTSKAFIELFLIMGAFFFMGKAADFICNILGVKKPDSNGGIFKGLAGIGAALGIAGGTIGSAATNFRAAREENKALHPNQRIRNALRTGASTVVGGAAGAFVGGKAFTTSKDHQAAAVMKAIRERNAQRAAHSTLFGRAADTVYGAVTGESLSQRDQYIYDSNKKASDLLKSYKSMLQEEARKSDKKGILKDFKNTSGVKEDRPFNYEKLVAAMNSKDATGNFKYDKEEYNVSQFDANVMNKILDSQSEAYRRSVYDEVTGEFTGNAKLKTQWQNTRFALRQADIEFDGKYDDIGKTIGQANEKMSQMETNMRNVMHRANNQNKK